jgi:uncharacterized membrane protein YhhN
MDNKIFLLIILFLIIVHTFIYVKFVVYDENNNIEFYIKWIPVFLLCTQTIILACYYKCKHNDKKMYKYCLFLLVAYIFCAIGDILLIFNIKTFFMIGMIMFMFSHFVFGFGRFYNIKKYAFSDNKFKNILGIIIVTIIQLCYVPYVIMETLQNEKFNSILIIVAICVYSCFINFSVTSNYIYLISFGTLRAWFSFIGVLIFSTSDCILILNDIKYCNKYLEIIVLLLYWYGLTLISWAAYQSKEINYIILNNENDQMIQ